MTGKRPSSIQPFDDTNEFQLPKLEALCVNSRYKEFRGIIANILKAASNLIYFDGFSMNERDIKNDKCFEKTVSAEDLAMMRMLNKLHCLKNLQICVSEELIGHWMKSSKCLDLQLQYLTLSAHRSVLKSTSNELKSNATEIINQLLHSSKNTLRTLAIRPLRLLNVSFPKMENLRKLDLCNDHPLSRSNMLPSQFDFADNFPNLKWLGK